ncbi:MAG TPA: sulfotransferase domain-containing protein [Caulobacteraceae bacterium]|jgi:aryl sulfotransferase|nr:sulfotransferase domain-containing protein [Caulobacteraceae bacterium]
MPSLVRPPLREVRSRIFDSARWAGYQPRAGDVVISTYPKCGTTWTQRIVGMLQAGSAAPFSVHGPWFDFRLGPPVEVSLGEAEAVNGPRYLKSHLPYEALPVYEGVKFIHTARDGRDSAMSFHNHIRGFLPHMVEVIRQVSLNDPKFGDEPVLAPESAAEYFGQWLEDGGGFGDPGASYWEMERSYWGARREPNMLLVHYNDLKADLAGEIARIARFLELEVAPKAMDEIVAAADFKAMSAQGAELLPGIENVWVEGPKTFLYKGVNGRWQGVVSDLDLTAYKAKVAREFTPALAAWLEQGRSGAGDPATAAD